MAFYGKQNGSWEKLSTYETYKTFSLVAGDGAGEVRAINEDGTERWANTSSHTDIVSDVTIDENLNAYTSSNDGSIRKFDLSNGNELEFDNEGANNGEIISAITYSQGYIFTGSDNNTIRKYDAENLGAGSIWNIQPHGSVINGIGTDNNLNVYSVSADNKIKKIDGKKSFSSPTSPAEWTYNGDRTFLGVYVGPAGNAYACDLSGDTVKVDSTGQQVWKKAFASSIEDFALNEKDGYLYAAESGGNVIKLDTDGNEIYRDLETSSSIKSISVDKQGIIYIGTSDNTLIALEDITDNTVSGYPFIQNFTVTTIPQSVEGTSVRMTT